MLALLLTAAMLCAGTGCGTGCAGCARGMVDSVTSCGAKGDSLADVLSRGEMTFGIAPDFMPFSAIDEGVPTGMSVDIALEVAKRLNITPNFKVVAQGDAQSALDNGEIDCYIDFAAPDIKATSQMLTIDLKTKNRIVAAVRADSGMSTLYDLTGRKAVVVSGSDAAAALDEAVIISENLGGITRVQNEEALFALLRGGQCDTAVTGEPRVFYEQRGGEQAIAIVGEPLAQTDLFIAFRLRNDSLRERVNVICEDMTADGQMKTIRERWLGEGK